MRNWKRMVALGMTAAMLLTSTALPVSAAEIETEESVGAEQGSGYVLMNIPYAEFYEAEGNNDKAIDVFTSATKSKVRTVGLAGGSYHADDSGDAILGVTYPVKVPEGVDLSAYKEVVDSDVVEITVTNRGQTSTTTLQGADALFENPSYSWYELSEVPAYYKELTVEADGSFSFGKAVGEVTTTEAVEPRFTTNTTYGDYQLEVTLPEELSADDTVINAVLVSTTEGHDYGMRHLENIWRKSELAWCTGYTEAVHNCPTSSEPYMQMVGEHINKVTYYTSKGIYVIPMAEEAYVMPRIAASVKVEDAAVEAGTTTVTVEGLKAGVTPVYTVDGLSGAKVENGTLTFPTSAAAGKYTLQVADEKDEYVALTADFVLSSSKATVAFDAASGSLKAVSGATADAVSAYAKNITSVSVDGKAYASSGRGATVIVNPDGTIKADAAPIAAVGSYKIEITATGYPVCAFTYVVAEKTPDATVTPKPTAKPTAAPKVKLAKQTIKKVTPGKKKITVTWKKNKKASGYQVVVYANKSCKKVVKTVNIKKNTKTKVVIKKLKSKKTYYVKVRSYQKKGKVYGKFSKAKKVKVK